MAAGLAAIIAATPEADMDTMVGALTTIRPAFGRGEKVLLPNGVELHLQLVKNPAGFRHALQQVKSTDYTTIGVAINDDYADGRDVSWLWDVDFSIFKELKATIMTGGTRAADMANRLKYDDLMTAEVEPEFATFLRHMTQPTRNPAIIFCTYTAMLRLRKLLKHENKSIRSEGL
jgi:UDP-N-acetylmuramyl tripeptide synthase